MAGDSDDSVRGIVTPSYYLSGQVNPSHCKNYLRCISYWGRANSINSAYETPNMQKLESDSFVDLFVIGPCLQLEVSSSGIFSDILHQTEMTKSIKFIWNISLMTTLGHGEWKPTKEKFLGTYWITGTHWWLRSSNVQIQRRHLKGMKTDCICRKIGFGFSNIPLERHLDVCLSFTSYLWARHHLRSYRRFKDS